MANVKGYYLRKNHSVRFPKHLIFFDTETTERDIDDETKLQVFRLAVACYVRRDRNKEEYLFTKSKEELADFVAKHTFKRYNTYVFAHNLFYDLKSSDLIHYLVTRHGFKVKKLFITSADNLILSLVKDTKKITFIDSTAIFKSSIAELGKSIGLPKLTVDFANVDDDTLFEYCKRDVDILKEVLLRFIDFLKDNDLGSLGYTIASTSMKVYRHKFLNSKILIHKEKEIQKLEKKAYYGGRVEAFIIGQPIKGVFKLDINSMYPYVMKVNKYPTKIIAYKENVSLYELQKRLNIGQLCIAEVELETNKEIYPFRFQNKLYFPVGRFLTYLSTPEIKLALKHNHIVNVRKAVFYKSDKIFTEFVDYMYKQREEAKKNGDKAMSMFYKILMNSLYGKFAQKQRKIIHEFDLPEPAYYSLQVKLEDKIIQELAFYNKVFYIGREEEFSKNTFVAISSHVTAYARVYLWKLMTEAGLENVYYVDTDSLFVNEKGFKRLKKYIDDYELGKLKIEGIGTLTCWGAKHYLFNDIYKCKAIPKKAVKNENGEYEWWSFERLRGSLKNEPHEGVLLVKRKRSIKTPYDKRYVNEDGSTRPLTVDEIMKTREQDIKESITMYMLKEKRKIERETKQDIKMYKERLKELLRDYEEVCEANIEFEVKRRQEDDLLFWLSSV